MTRPTAGREAGIHRGRSENTRRIPTQDKNKPLQTEKSYSTIPEYFIKRNTFFRNSFRPTAVETIDMYILYVNWLSKWLPNKRLVPTIFDGLVTLRDGKMRQSGNITKGNNYIK